MISQPGLSGFSQNEISSRPRPSRCVMETYLTRPSRMSSSKAFDALWLRVVAAHQHVDEEAVGALPSWPPTVMATGSSGAGPRLVGMLCRSKPGWPTTLPR